MWLSRPFRDLIDFSCDTFSLLDWLLKVTFPKSWLAWHTPGELHTEFCAELMHSHKSWYNKDLLCYSIKCVKTKITRVNHISVSTEQLNLKLGKKYMTFMKQWLSQYICTVWGSWVLREDRETKLQRADMKFQESSWPPLRAWFIFMAPPPFVDAVTYKKKYFISTLLVYRLECIYILFTVL